MHEQLQRRVQDTKRDMVSHPNDKKPARPVAAAEHKHAAKNREQPDEAYPDNVILKRTVCLELGGVVGKSDDPGSYEYVTDDGD